MDEGKMQVFDLTAPAPVREIAEMISSFRKEYLDSLVNGVVDEATEVDESDFDPAQGSGRGPWWADGG